MAINFPAITANGTPFQANNVDYLSAGNGTNSARWEVGSQASSYLPLTGGTLTGALAGTTAEFGANGIPLTVNSTNSNSNKIQLEDAGTVRGYLGSSNGNCFHAADTAGSNKLTVTNAGVAMTIGSTTPGPAGGAGAIALPVGVKTYQYIETDTAIAEYGVHNSAGESSLRLTTNSGGNAPVSNYLIRGATNNHLWETNTASPAGQFQFSSNATNPAGIYVSKASTTQPRQAINGRTTLTAQHPTNATSYGVFGEVASVAGKPAGGTIGVEQNSVYAILGYYTGTQSWAMWANGSTWSTGSYQGSDIRLKDIQEPITGVLDKLKVIQPVKYTWKENTDQRKAVNGDKPKLGVIAQEVETVFPELIVEIDSQNSPIKPKIRSLNEDLGSYKTVEYNHLTAVLLQGLKEATARIEVLEAKLNEKESN